MKVISHRGNVHGPSKYTENLPDQILMVIGMGFDVEIDLWKTGDELFLGHDLPQYQIGEDFLIENGGSLWIHCKNLEALSFLNTIFPQLNYFWHQNDDYTITSQGYIWAYPGNDVSINTVIVDLQGGKEYDCYAMCSDYIN